ncbi:MAG: gamma-glutamyltransferase [Novosphingobium sp.]
MTGRHVASSASPAATAAAIELLEQGAPAFVAAAAALAVLFVELPMSCGIGGDLAIVGVEGSTQQPFGFCGLGQTPQAVSAGYFLSRGMGSIPKRGILSATVPAALPTLERFLAKHGRTASERIFEPAIRRAEAMTIDARFTKWTRNNIETVRSNADLSALYLADDGPLPPGTVLTQSALAATLTKISSDPGYSRSEDLVGSLAKTSARFDGAMTAEDFRAVDVDTSLCRLRCAGHEIYTTPLPTQGHVLLRSLDVYSRVAPPARPDEAHRIHLLSEVFNQAYQERLEMGGDPSFVARTERLFDPRGAAEMAGKVNREFRSDCPYSNWYNPGDTTQLVVADSYGNAVTMIASLSLGFGSGVIDPETGVIFNNRLGRSATLRADHANRVEPGKRPVNTIQAFLARDTHDGLLLGGTPGGDGQVQWNADLLSKVLLHGVPMEEAIAEPRFTHFPGAEQVEVDGPELLQIEHGSASIEAELSRRGHKVRRKARVQGCLRVAARRGNKWLVADDGHEEGATVAV